MSKTTEAVSNLSPMQAEVLKRADAIFDSIAKTVSQAKDFAAEQIPDIALQYVAWGRSYLSVYIVVALILLAAGLWLSIRVGIMNSRNIPDSDVNHESKRTAATIIGFILSFVGSFTFFANMKEFMMVWFAPKIWILNEIVHLVKSQ